MEDSSRGLKRIEDEVGPEAGDWVKAWAEIGVEQAENYLARFIAFYTWCEDNGYP